jgi:hypothetical protein
MEEVMIKYLNLYLETEKEEDDSDVWGYLHDTEEEARKNASMWCDTLLIAYPIEIKD